MSDAFWVALFGLAGTCLTALLSYLNRQELKTVNGHSAELAGKTDALIETTGRIKHLVNSTTDELKSTIVSLRADAVIANDRIDQLTKIIDLANANIERLTQTALRDRRGHGGELPS